MSELSSKDRKILLEALASGRAFEKFFNSENENMFRMSLDACASGDSFLIQKLAELAGKVSLGYGPKHLMGLLVPIERLAGRSARDEEFLFEEKDGAAKNSVAAHGKRIVLCENIRSAFNVGAVYRTAETFGGSEVWLAGYTPDPQKTAMGADALVSSRRFERTADAVVEAKKLGYKVVALENSPGAVTLENFVWPEDTVVLLGNERFGVDSQTIGLCDHVVRISTSGQKNSLNVGIAFGVAASQWRSHSASLSSDALSPDALSPDALTSDALSPVSFSPAGSYAQTTSDQARSAPARSTMISPIGRLRGGFQNPQIAPRQGAYSNATASIELEARFEGRPSNFEQALKDLVGFERAWIVFGFDRSEGWNPQVRPPRGDGTKRGLFATRSPHRPNRLGLSCVRILSVSGRSIEIAEHDLLEGTPIYDIKPYVPGADSFPNAKAGWLDDVDSAAYQVRECDEFSERVRWLEENGETRIRDFISEQLTFQPFDENRKRLVLGENQGDTHTIAFRTWRIKFRADSRSSIEVLSLHSGYTDDELNKHNDGYSDLYNDKELHRAFQKAFDAKN